MDLKATLKKLADDGKKQGEDFVCLSVGGSVVVVEYLGETKWDQLSELADLPPDASREWELEHVAFPSRDEVRAKLKRFPIFRKRLTDAVLFLYGAAEEATLGKVTISPSEL